MSVLTLLINISFAQCCILCIIGALTFLFVRSLLNRHANLPPGPHGYPILGAIPLFKPKVHESYAEWAKIYGDVFSLYIGNKLMVIVSGTDTMKEVFIKNGEHLLDRPQTVKNGVYNFGEGVVLGEGPVWKEHRKLMTKGLRVLASGDSLESRVQRECGSFAELISREKGQPFDPTNAIFKAVMNISMTAFYGIELEHGSEEFNKAVSILHLIEEMDLANPLLMLPQLVPLLKPLFYFLGWKGTRKLQVISRAIGDFVGRWISDCRQTYDEGVTRGILDTYFHRQQMDENQGETCIFDENELTQVAFDVFVAGGDTTQSTLRWAILFMLYNPGILEKVREEIDRVIGLARLPAMSDKPQMPYTEATICEIQRCGNISFIGIPRIATQDIQVGDYIIPKGSRVAPNLHYLHRDARYWKDPDTFDPTRFLDNTGQNVFKPEAFMPFGLGPRVCLGEQLAKMELFLMFTTLIQRFEISAIDKNNLPSLEIKRGLVFGPHHYQIHAEPR